MKLNQDQSYCVDTKKNCSSDSQRCFYSKSSSVNIDSNRYLFILLFILIILIYLFLCLVIICLFYFYSHRSFLIILVHAHIGTTNIYYPVIEVIRFESIDL
jgi:hypothetical protein